MCYAYRYVQYDETKTMYIAVTSVIPPGTLVYKPNAVTETKVKRTPVIAWVVAGMYFPPTLRVSL